MKKEMRSSITLDIREFDKMKSALKWNEVGDSMPHDTEILVCVTYNLDDRSYETKQWVDEYCPELGWRFYGERIDIPFPPTHWRNLPPSPFI